VSHVETKELVFSRETYDGSRREFVNSQVRRISYNLSEASDQSGGKFYMAVKKRTEDLKCVVYEETYFVTKMINNIKHEQNYGCDDLFGYLWFI
jgi:hypothetical protein